MASNSEIHESTQCFMRKNIDEICQHMSKTVGDIAKTNGIDVNLPAPKAMDEVDKTLNLTIGDYEVLGIKCEAMNLECSINAVLVKAGVAIVSETYPTTQEELSEFITNAYEKFYDLIDSPGVLRKLMK